MRIVNDLKGFLQGHVAFGVPVGGVEDGHVLGLARDGNSIGRLATSAATATGNKEMKGVRNEL
jgi:hypothetical protein